MSTTICNSKFSYVDITTAGCEGWLNLFYDGHAIALIDNGHIANSIRAQIDGAPLFTQDGRTITAVTLRDEISEAIDNVIGNNESMSDDAKTELRDLQAHIADQYGSAR